MGSNTVGGGFADGEVLALTVWDSGQGAVLYAGGSFTMADGVPAAGIARWNGTSWSDVGAHPPYWINDFAIFDDGTGPALYAAGGFRIWRFDGTSWTEISCSPNAGISEIAVFNDGNGSALFVGGYFTQIGGIAAMRLARFDGVNWAPVGGGIPSNLPGLNGQIDALDVYENGGRSELVVSGRFDSVGGLTVRCFASWRTCSGTLDTLCFGDGTTRACPCGNQGALGHGCANSSQSVGAILSASGDPANDTVVLTATNQTPSGLTIVVQATDHLDTVVPFGDGILCLDGTLVRLYSKNAVGGMVVVPAAGDPSIATRSAARGDPLSPGAIRYYQTYYRDANATFCAAPTGGTFNVSNGVRVVW